MHSRPYIMAVFFFFLAGCATTAPVNRSAEVIFKEGEELYASKQYEDAIAAWKKVKESFSTPELTAQAELKIADAQFDSGSYIEAASSYEEFRKFHPKHEKAPYALYRMGMCNFNQIERLETDQTPVKNAVVYFDQFVREYPKDPLAPEVAEKLEICRQKQLAYELYIGKFYLRTEKYKAAVKRFSEALVRYPNAPSHDETLFYIGQAYILDGEKEKGRDAFNQLFSNYPGSPYINGARKFMDKYY